MVRFANRPGGSRRILFLALAGVAALASACDFHYRAAADPALDEVVVRAIPNARSAYDHPVRLSAQELGSILQEVRVQFTSNWLQRLITGPLEAVPLFDEAALARVAPQVAEALVQAGARDRIVFYVAHRKANDRRDVTSGTLFVKGRGLTIALVNHQNRVDVVPGLTAYDRQAPEVAVAPQRFSLVFGQGMFVIDREGDTIDQLLETAPPTLMVDYARFLEHKSRTAAAPGIAETKKVSR